MLKRAFLKFGHTFCSYPILTTIAVSALVTAATYLFSFIFSWQDISTRLPDALLGIALGCVVLVMPFVLTAENIIFLLLRPTAERNKAARSIELLTVIWGSFLSLLCLYNVYSIRIQDWNVQLYNGEVHSPIALGSFPTIIVIALAAIAGYLVSRFVPLKRQPPLVSVLCISAMYLGIGLCIVWCIQVWKEPIHVFLCLLPVNCIIIAAKTIRALVTQKAEAAAEAKEPQKFRRLSKLLDNASSWPWLSLLFAIPLLGVVIVLLLLFGQQPDSIIKAWTGTADWNLSQQTPPPNIIHDEHYLCTVAAGGHHKVVKPLRTGKRHGHEVVVNRQLCVANAFEQLLEERTPRFHRAVRGFYDKAGYPVAKHIRSPYLADAVYFMMKPLEWLFTAVLYLFDTSPENRIAVQYPHAPVPRTK